MLHRTVYLPGVDEEGLMQRTESLCFYHSPLLELPCDSPGSFPTGNSSTSYKSSMSTSTLEIAPLKSLFLRHNLKVSSYLHS